MYVFLFIKKIYSLFILLFITFIKYDLANRSVRMPDYLFHGRDDCVKYCMLTSVQDSIR